MKPQTKTLLLTLLGLAGAAIAAATLRDNSLAQPPPQPQPDPSVVVSPVDPRPPVPAPDFTLSTVGPRQVYAGHDLYFSISGKRDSGDAENTNIDLLQRPAGSDFGFPDLGRTCCGSNGKWFMWMTDKSFSTSVRLGVPKSLAPGTHSVEVQIKNTKLDQTVRYTFEVLPDLPALKPTYATLGKVPGLARYNELMVAKGRANLGNREQIIANTLWEGNSWYYDGTRVAYQIAEYTGDESFKGYARNPLDVYRPYVVDNNGAIPGWRVFPQGLRMDYERTGDAISKTAAILLLNAALGAKGIVTNSLIPEATSREVAYAIDAMLEAEKLGQPRHARLPEYVDIALGHIDQWFVQEKFERMAPFMFALTAEALIKYHEATNDPRILPALKLGADWIWAKAWAPTSKAFVYEFVPGSPLGAGSPDLNLLIVPVYGWIYHQTGDARYIEKGDQIFAGGVDGAWLDQGKQFNQSYRWSMDYLRWRSAKMQRAREVLE